MGAFWPCAAKRHNATQIAVECAPMALLDTDQKALSLRLAREGITIKKLLESLHCTGDTFYGTLQHDLAYRESFACARDQGLDQLADDLIDLADQYVDVQKARLKSDNIKWLLARRAHKRYGDKLDINMHQTVDIGGALIDARKRALQPASNLQQISDAQVTDYVRIAQRAHSDIESSEPVAGQDCDAWDVFK